MINYALIGCGTITPKHIEAIKNVENANLLALFSRNEEKAAKWGEKYNVDFYSNYQQLLKDDRIDTCVILTPSGYHYEYAASAAKAKKNIITEKPLEITNEKAQSLIDLCKEEGVTLSCIFQHRFDPSVVKVKEAIDKGELGQLNFGAARVTWYRPQSYYDSGAWRGTVEIDGGGALMNQSIHYLDILLYLMGPVEEVFAYTTTRAHERIEVEDIATATVKFKSGAIGLIEGSTAAYPGFDAEVDVFGSLASVRMAADEITDWHKVGKDQPYIQVNKSSNISGDTQKNVDITSFIRQYEDITNAIINDTDPLVTGEEAIKSVNLILAIYKSAKTNQPVKL